MSSRTENSFDFFIHESCLIQSDRPLRNFQQSSTSMVLSQSIFFATLCSFLTRFYWLSTQYFSYVWLCSRLLHVLSTWCKYTWTFVWSCPMHFARQLKIYCWTLVFAQKLDQRNIMLCCASTVTVIINCRKRRRQEENETKRMWVKECVSKRVDHRAYHALLQELQEEDLGQLRNFLRMDMDLFLERLQKVRPLIEKRYYHESCNICRGENSHNLSTPCHGYAFDCIFHNIKNYKTSYFFENLFN